MEAILQGVLSVLEPGTLIWVLIGTFVGIVFGSIPGLTATLAIAMFLPMTYGMSAGQGQATLMSLYIGGISEAPTEPEDIPFEYEDEEFDYDLPED